jgi:prepilin-type N-terminal cleavage/methylation domain-containing protein
MKETTSMNSPSIRSSRGFTVIEVLVTLLILSGGLLALAKYQGTMLGANTLAKQRTEATMLANQQLETLRAYTTVNSTCPAGGDYCNIATGNDSVTGASATYARTWTVTPSVGTLSGTPTLKCTAGSCYKQVTLAVTWTDSSNTAQSVTLNSNIAFNNPLNTGNLIANASTPFTPPATPPATPPTTTPPAATAPGDVQPAAAPGAPPNNCNGNNGNNNNNGNEGNNGNNNNNNNNNCAG